MLPLPLSTEIAMQSLMNEALNYSNTGKYKISYELYVKALSSAIKEFKQMKFMNDYAIGNDLSPLFSLVNDCLRQIKDITLRCNMSQKPPPPPIPPKPSKLKITPPPPPPKLRPIEMKRAKSKPEFVNRSIYSEDEDEEGKGIRKASTPSLKIITNKSRITRRSSASSSAPSSPLSSVSNPFNAVKSFLSLPSDGKKPLYSPAPQDSEDEDIFLLANGMIDPHVLVTAQTHMSNNSLSNTNNTYVPMIPQAPLITKHKALQKQLEEEKSSTTDVKCSLNRVQTIHMSATTIPTILQFHPVLIAYQLTLIDSTIFRNIPVEAILSHSTKAPHPSIVASTDFFNYLTRIIEHAILLQQEASGRAQHINHWIKVAGKCCELKNYQTLKAVICALGTPPIQRLKRSWQFIPKKSMSLYEDLCELMSETSNYGKYREKLGLIVKQDEELTQSGEPQQLKKSIRKNSFSEPTVPFLGIFIHDMTYLTAAVNKQQQQQQHSSGWKLLRKEELHDDVRVTELIKLFRNLQRSPPYSPTLSSTCIKDLRKRKLAHALTRTPSMKKLSTHYYHQEEEGEWSVEMQQCLITQYLLTRSWVSEKTVDELSLVREPTTKNVRSYSVHTTTESPTTLAVPLKRAQSAGGGVYIQSPPPVPPLHITSSDSSVTNQSTDTSTRNSITSASSSSRPTSLEESDMDNNRKSSGGFWLFGRKSTDQAFLCKEQTNRSPKQFSFVEDAKRLDCRMQREESQGSLASSIFRKDFWKNQPRVVHGDPVPLERKESSSSAITPSFEIINFSWE